MKLRIAPLALLATAASLSVRTAGAQQCIGQGSACTEIDTPDNCCAGLYCEKYSQWWNSCQPPPPGGIPPPPDATNMFELRMSVSEDNLDQIRIITRTNAANPPCVYEPAVTPQISLVPGPWSAQLNKLESNTNLFLWQEKTGVTLASDLPVDVLHKHSHFEECGTYQMESVDYSVGKWCGSDWTNAQEACAAACDDTGFDQECVDALGPGYKCFSDVDCSQFASDPARRLQVAPPSWADVLVADPQAKYNSYMIHGNNEPGIAGTYLAAVTFYGQTIVAVQYTKEGLDNTDALFGLDTTLYPKRTGSAQRGFELQTEGDLFKVCRKPDITLAGVTCPETAATECEETVNLGSHIGPASGDNAYQGDYPKMELSAPMEGPLGRDDSTAFLTLGNLLSKRAAEIEGRMVIGRNMVIDPTGANSLVQAGYGSGIIPNAGTDIILVGGDIIVDRYVSVMETGTTGGNVVYRGTYDDKGSDGLGLGAGGQILYNADLDLSMYEDIVDNLALMSAYWATLTPNGVFTPYPEGPNGNTALLEAGSDEACIQVFHIKSSDLINYGWGFNVQFAPSLADKTILINVQSDTSNNLAELGNLADFIDPYGNAGLAFDTGIISNIIWNFYDAEHVELGSGLVGNGQFRGSILIPNGSLRSTMPGQSGRVVVRGDIVQDLDGSEFHNYPFDPPCPLPTPPDFELPPDCQTPAPIALAPPTETGAPTMAPTPVQCPEDLELLMTVGSTQWSSGELPIVILEQTGDHVTFRISQEYAESVNYMYVLFDQAETSDEICYTHADVEPEATFTYTAMCTVETQLTMVEIWVADDSFDPVTDTAEVPECCHAPDDDTYPKVQYCFELHCVSQCPDDYGETDTVRGLRG